MSRNKEIKLSLLFAIIIFSAIALTIPKVEARGGHHAGGNHSSLGSHGGHRGNHGGHRHFGSGHKHFGGQRHFGRHRSHIGGHNRSFGSRRHFGNHRHFGRNHTRFGHRRNTFRNTGRHRSIYRQNYNYYPRSYGYTPRYSSRSYSSYQPRYSRNNNSRSYSSYSSRYTPRRTTYSSVKTYTPKTSKGIYMYSAYNNTPTDTRYIENDMESKVTNNAGWEYLARNQSSEALNFFAGQAGRYQTDGVPKVGFALSTAMQGDLHRAVWAMRRAFSIDPGSLHYIRIEPPLRVSINNLIAEYNNRLNSSEGYGQSDSVFMIAALNYLLHDNNAARKAIGNAIDKEEDNSQSAQNLYNLLINAE
ncbi:MAG: hypothetical protein K0U40_09145 [Betaproteobacteria bacterium]|nr:hypothetical protein [Betaproteobacteria bacterium]